MALVLAPQPWLIFLDDDGRFVPSGQLAIYEAGTSTPAFTYADINGTAHPWPITLDGAGRVPGGLYLTPGYSYKFVLHAPKIVLPLSGAIIKTQDNIAISTGGGPAPPQPGTLDILGTLGNAALPGVPMYMSDGEAGLTPGLCYYANATNEYSSTQPPIAFTVIGGGVGDIVPLRAAGLIERNPLLPPMVPGRDYYVNTSDATITNVAPLFARFLGRAQTTQLLLVNANPAVTSGVQRTTRINVPGAPYNIQWPPTTGVPNGALTTDGLGNLSWTIGGGGGAPAAHAPSHETGGTDPILHLAGGVIDTGTVADARLTVNVLKHAAGYPGGTSNFLRADGAFAVPPGAGGVPAHRLTHETGGSDALQNLSAGILTTGEVPDARLSVNVLKHPAGYPGGTINFLRADGTFTMPTGLAPAPHATTHNTGGSDPITALAATVLTTGILPDARFPSVLPAVSGANLTNLDANDLATGIVPNARFPATLPVASAANLTNVNATALVGTVPDANLSANVALKNAANVFTLGQTAPSLQATAPSFPFLAFNATGEPVDLRSFQILPVAQVLIIRSINDAGSIAGPGIELRRNGFISGPGQVRVSLFRATGLNINSGVLESIGWDGEVFDVGPCHVDGSAGAVVPANGAGTYLVMGTVSYAPFAGGTRMARIRKNGVGEEAVTFIASAGTAVNTTANVQAILQLVAGDILELVAFQDSGSPLGVIGSKFSWIKVW